VKAFAIILRGHAYSETVGARCIESAARVGGIEVEAFPAIGADRALEVMAAYGFEWTWTSGGECPITGLKQHSYGGGLARVGCAMSHFLLWRRCVALGEPVLILEHDSVFLRPWPEFEFRGLCQVNDPAGATRRGDWLSSEMASRGPGVFPSSWTTDRLQRIPDGLAGNSAYVIKPFAARHLIDLYRRLGVWPNDATMCKQLIPYLEELYPFVTKVEQTVSTTNAG